MFDQLEILGKPDHICYQFYPHHQSELPRPLQSPNKCGKTALKFRFDSLPKVVRKTTQSKRMSFYFTFDMFMQSPSVGEFPKIGMHSYPCKLPTNWIDMIVQIKKIKHRMDSLNYLYPKEIFILTPKKHHTDKVSNSQQDILVIKLNSENNVVNKIEVRIILKPITWKRYSGSITLPLHLETLPYYCISMAGVISSMKLTPKSDISVTLYWIHDNYNKYIHYLHNSPVACKGEIYNYRYCLNYSSVSDKMNKSHYYIFFSNLHPVNEPQKYTDNLIKRTWAEAAATCRSVGGYLPIIRSKSELEEIISLLKLTKKMPPVVALHVGLVDHPEYEV